MDNMQYRFGEFCRVCLRRNIDLVYLKSEDNDLITYFEKLQSINNESITDGDIFPNWICIKCKTHLCYCYKFFQKCQKAVTVLKECLEQIKQANHGDSTTKFYITHIKDVETSTTIEDDPLIIKEEWNNDEENKNSNEEFTIKIKQELEELNENNEVEQNLNKMEELTSIENNCIQTIKIEPNNLDFQNESTNLDHLETNILESLLVPKLDQNKKAKSKSLEQNRRVSGRVKKKNKKYVINSQLAPPILEPNAHIFIKNVDQNIHSKKLNPPVLEPIIQLHKLDLKQNYIPKKLELNKTSSKRIINPPKKLDPSFVSSRARKSKNMGDPLVLDTESNKNEKKIIKKSKNVQDPLLLDTESTKNEKKMKKSKNVQDPLLLDTESTKNEKKVKKSKNASETVPEKKKKIDLDSVDPVVLDAHAKFIYRNRKKTINTSFDDLGFEYTKTKVRGDLGNDDKLLYTCKVCYKTFKLKENLLTHAIYHDTYNKYNCSVCGTSFRYKEYFLKHLEIHANFPSDCKICKQSFEDNRLLDKHYKLHAKTEQKTLKSLLKQNTAKDEEIVTCNICHLKFKGKRPLIAHMRSHYD